VRESCESGSPPLLDRNYDYGQKKPVASLIPMEVLEFFRKHKGNRFAKRRSRYFNEVLFGNRKEDQTDHPYFLRMDQGTRGGK
jgi:hypothetical protein